MSSVLIWATKYSTPVGVEDLFNKTPYQSVWAPFEQIFVHHTRAAYHNICSWDIPLAPQMGHKCCWHWRRPQAKVPLWSLLSLALVTHPFAFSCILAISPLLLHVGHVIWPNVLVGVVTGRCSMAARVPSSTGTIMVRSGCRSLAFYRYVPSEFHEKEIRC